MANAVVCGGEFSKYGCVCVCVCTKAARMKKCTMNKRNDETKWLSHNVLLASVMLVFVCFSIGLRSLSALTSPTRGNEMSMWSLCMCRFYPF